MLWICNHRVTCRRISYTRRINTLRVLLVGTSRVLLRKMLGELILPLRERYTRVTVSWVGSLLHICC